MLADPVLVIGAASNIGTYLLQPVVKTIGDAHADHYRIRQRLGPNAEIIEDLQTGAIDVAITEWWHRRPGFDATMWREEDLVVIVGPGHPWWQRDTVTLDELAEQTILGGEPTSGAEYLFSRRRCSIRDTTCGPVRRGLRLGALRRSSTPAWPWRR